MAPWRHIRSRSLSAVRAAFVMFSGAALFVLGAACAPAPASPTTSPAAGTYAKYADDGKTVYSGRCSKCHGDRGEGVTAPAIMGPGGTLAKFNTAQGLYTFISVAMPFDAPGSLPEQDYYRVLCFLLVQNKYVQGNAVFDPGALQSVQLK